MPTVIPDAVRDAAVFPISEGPPIPQELPIEKITTSLGCTILLLPGPTGTIVEARSLEPCGVEEALRGVRGLVRERGKSRAAWWVSEGAEPAGLAGELQRLGLGPYDEPPFEPRFAAMVGLEPPALGPDNVDAHAAETFDEYIA